MTTPGKHQFVQIINDHSGIIRSLCGIYYTDLDDRKDAFQDVVHQLWKSFDKFRGESKIGTWIYRVSLNTILARRRKERKWIETEPIEMVDRYAGQANADDHLELLQLVIRSLKDIDKGIVVLYLEGYHHKEIADILGISATNVATRFNRIKSHLKMKLNPAAHATR